MRQNSNFDFSPKKSKKSSSSSLQEQLLINSELFEANISLKSEQSELQKIKLLLQTTENTPEKVQQLLQKLKQADDVNLMLMSALVKMRGEIEDIDQNSAKIYYQLNQAHKISGRMDDVQMQVKQIQYLQQKQSQKNIELSEALKQTQNQLIQTKNTLTVQNQLLQIKNTPVHDASQVNSAELEFQKQTVQKLNNQLQQANNQLIVQSLDTNKLQRLENYNIELQNEVKVNSELNNSLKQTISSLQQQIYANQEKEMSARMVETQNTQFKQQLSMLQSEIALLKQDDSKIQVNVYKRENLKLNTQIQQLKAENANFLQQQFKEQQLSSEVSTLYQQLITLKSELARLKQQIKPPIINTTLINQSLTKLIERDKNSSEELAHTILQNKQITLLLKELRIKYQELEKTNLNYQLQIKNNNKEIEHNFSSKLTEQSQISELNAIIEELNADKNNIQKKLDSGIKEKTQLQKVIQESNNIIEQNKQQVKEKCVAIEQLEQKNAFLSEEIKSNQQKEQKKLADLQGEYQIEIQQLKLEIQQLMQSKQQIALELQAIQTKLVSGDSLTLKIQNQTTQIQQLQIQLNECKNRSEALEATASRFGVENTTLKTQLDITTNQLNQIRIQCEQLSNQISPLKQQKNMFELTIQNLNQENKQLKENSFTQQEENTRLQTELQNALNNNSITSSKQQINEEKIITLQIQLKEAQKTLRELNEQLQNQIQINKQQFENNTELQYTIQNAKTKENQMNNEIITKTELINELNNNNINMQKQQREYEQLKQETNFLIQSNQELKIQLNYQNQNQNNNSIIIQEQNEQINSLSEQIQILTTQFDYLQKEKQQIVLANKKTLIQTQKEHQNDKNEMATKFNQQLEEIHALVDQQSRQLENSKQNENTLVQQHQSQLNQLEQEYRTYQNQTQTQQEELQIQISNLQQNNNQLQSQLQSSEQKLIQQQQQNEEALNKLNVSLQEQTQTLEKLQVQINNHQDQIQEYQQIIEGYKQTISQNQLEITDLKSKLKIEKQQSDSLVHKHENALNQLQNQINKVQLQFDQATHEQVELKSQLKDSQDIINSLNVKLEQLTLLNVEKDEHVQKIVSYLEWVSNESESLQQQFDSLNSQFAQLQQSTQNQIVANPYKQSFDEYSNQLSDLQKQYQVKESTIINLKSELQTQQLNTELLLDSFQQAQKQLTDSLNNQLALKRIISKLESDLKHSTNLLSASNHDKVNDLTIQLNRELDNSQNLKNQITELKQLLSNQKHSSQQDSIQTEPNFKTTSLKLQLDHANLTIVQLTDQINQLTLLLNKNQINITEQSFDDVFGLKSIHGKISQIITEQIQCSPILKTESVAEIKFKLTEQTVLANKQEREIKRLREQIEQLKFNAQLKNKNQNKETIAEDEFISNMSNIIDFDDICEKI
ncbi:Hypothetical_protein [Hexamita inflata]|uniref:Hypothetical_protein n=1 Tax=Hexamita inflata TaxID=28002 RepID=A0AA86NS48_9EUKA|nr:Hypothetical protein HINF_LOCUS11495 [Hexamita inflata]